MRMKCQILFSGEKNIRKQITSLSSDELAQRMVKVIGCRTVRPAMVSYKAKQLELNIG